MSITRRPARWRAVYTPARLITRHDRQPASAGEVVIFRDAEAQAQGRSDGVLSVDSMDEATRELEQSWSLVGQWRTDSRGCAQVQLSLGG